MTDLRLVVFDVDGTLVDSQSHIMAAMSEAFRVQGLELPDREAILGLVGLSLDVLMPRLAPDHGADIHAALVQGYKDAFVTIRQDQPAAAHTPLFPGAQDVLDQLHAVPETLLGVATGKSRRGLDKVLEAHELTKRFVTEQVADHHPSKPHPAMLQACLAETGIAPARAVMVGDTSFDMEMAKAAGFYAVGVSWGYHERAELGAADVVIDHFEELHDVLKDYWG
ncbi:HAD-IA family hydrolase [Cognatishimia activa]|uniref:HAD-IA family hydrolase n=1 Tax=Cognatishimia activa TaxID=1715691 RepID=UPI0022311820|nr:HAD-IA family hydrolase [Cognatishimia activa]UZD91211.1 HAD-IA family hydrolase [Cognatishimia activa]